MPLEPGIPTKRSHKEWSTRGIKAYVMYMLEFLRISPSYELARQVNEEGLGEEIWRPRLFALFERGLGKALTEDQRIECVAGFRRVLATYHEFGDIRVLDFNSWWLNRGIEIFGADYDKPQVRKVAQLQKGELFGDSIVRSLEVYFRKGRLQEGSPPALILSIPLGSNKKAILAQISKLVDGTEVPVIRKTQRTKKPLTALRLRSLPLLKSIKILWFKARLPEIELWRLGIIAKVSPANAMGLDAKMKKPHKDTIDQRSRMAILTSRMLLKAKLISENAARGDYPSHKVILLPYFDYPQINERVLIRVNRKKKGATP